MQSLLRHLVVAGLATFAAVTASAQAPANDAFANAITLNGPIVTTVGSNVGATKAFGGGGGGEPSIPGGTLGVFGGASVWWNWTAAASGQTTINTEGSDFNTLLGVWTGAAQNRLTIVAGNDDFEGNQWSKVAFNAVAGTTYRIMVDGFRSGAGFGAPATGNIKLNVKGVGGLDISVTNGMVFTVGEPIPVSVTFTPDFPNPPATQVKFYYRSSPFTAPVLFATDDTEPFSALAENVPAGSNTIYVAAIDSLGSPVESPAANVLLQNVGVTLLTPFEDTMYLNSTAITVTAWGYLPAGSIAAVEFFVDGVKFAERDLAPFSGVWTNLTGGSHRFTAVGRSDTGARFTSQPVNVGVAGTLMPNGSVWKYLDDNSDQGTAWVATDFNDSAWASGPAPLGYGDSNGRPPATTNVFGPSDTAKYITTYFRRAFVISNAASFARINLNIERDDGAVVYLNGVELGRFNMPTVVVTSATFALNAGDDGVTVSTLAINPVLLADGVNVFAVEIHQDALNSSDIWFQMNLQGIPTIIHNLSPLVDLTTPTNGAYFLAPSQIALAATASDNDGSVVKVEFFADGVKIGEDAEAPYEAVWINPSVAAHILTAVATDDQGGTSTSVEIPIVVYDAVGTPVAKVTAPPDGHIVEGPTNMLVTATANAITGVVNVQFLANDVEYASDSTAPYSAVWPAPFGTNILTVIAIDAGGVRGTSPPIVVVVTIPPTNVIAPIIFTQSPLAGVIVTNTLTSIKVIFSERALNVDASDLLINGVPATGMTGNGSLSNYTFTFPQPAYGAVNITWAGGHGITDYGYPTNLPFDETGPGATWTYDLVDQLPPRVLARTPAPGSTVTNLTEITVTFTEAVGGVDAADLLVNGFSALNVSGSGANYTFTLPAFGTGLKTVTWSTNNDIFDLAVTPNPFSRTLATNNWSFTLDTRYAYVQTNTAWLFIKGTAEASDPTNAWRQLDYDASSWSNSPAPFFYGETTLTNANYPGTTLSDMQSNYTSIYLRKEFNVENRGNITNLILLAQVDDGFIAWINGVQMVRVNMPAGEVPYNAVATAQATEPNNNGAAWVVYQMPASAAALVDGTNVIAIHAFNQNLTNSSDFSFNAQVYTYLLDPTTVGPRLLEPEPKQGDVLALNNLVITFSEAVSGVNATDLLINGTPAVSVSSDTNTIYSFTFPQPPYGPVIINWDTNHGIADFDGPPKPFNDASTNATLRYFLINPSNPKIATQAPLSGSTVTGLTAIAVTFTEAVSGVEASDLLVSGSPASAVTSADNITYNFTFPQPSFGSIAIRWSTNHGIVDVEAGNAFDPTRFGGQWNYTLIDPVPSITLTSPTNNTFFLPPARITLRATASDNDGTVALVEFYESTTKIGEGTNAPYSLALSNLDVGAYTFRAVATDNIGLSRTSAPAVINVVTSLPITLVRGPYLNSGSPTGGVVRWRTSAISDGLVYYGTDLSNLTNVAQETSVTNEHIVQLAGLEPGTKYYYSIGSAAYRLVGGTNDGGNYWFKSSPEVGTRKPTRLWVLGDAGTAGNSSPTLQASTRDSFYAFAATNGPADMVMMLGDNAYNSGTDAEHQAAVFDMYPTTLRNLFLWPTLGNHETAQSTTTTDFPYLHIFSLPKAGEVGGVPSGTEKYYSYDYGNIHFVCLDSMTSGQTADTPMANWLRSDLESTSQEWIIVFFHHPPYTKASHNSDTEQDLVRIRQNLNPILETNGVDLVLSGHSHAYERSVLLNGHYGLANTIRPEMKIDAGDGRDEGTGPYQKNAQGQGTVYTVAGSSGQATFLQADAPHQAMHLTLLELGSMVIDVSGNRLDALFLRENGTIQDRFTITKPSPFPPAPRHLVALPTSATEINLTWDDAAENELGYSVERSTDGINFTAVLDLAANITSLLDASVSANTTYFYRVRGTNSIGVGDYSNIASATTVLPDSVPRAPIALVANADNGVEFFRSQMVLRWQDRSTNEAAFQIERSGDGASFIPVATVAANLTSYVDRHLDSATFYYYRVRAVNALGQSAPSPVASNETHPQTQLARAGDSVTFHAGAEGTEPVRYQWRFMDVAIPGETNETIVLADVQLFDEGDYSVVIRDNVGRVVSNPAFLFVVAPPRILAQPQDLLAVVGTSVSLDATVEGTGPMRYQWHRNGNVIPGATSPTLAFPSVQLTDRAGYYLVIENDFGSAISRVARLEAFVAPVLATIPDILADVLRPLVFSVAVTDANVPPLSLVYSLAPGAPTNASIHPVKGEFHWTPTRSQAPGTNLITVQVTDATRPILSHAVSFTVEVNDYIELTLGEVPLLAGGTNSVPIDLVSTEEIAGLQFVLQFPDNLLSNLWVEAISTNLASASVQPSGANAATFDFATQPGISLFQTQRLARLHFTAGPGQVSAFVPLHLEAVSVTTSAPDVAPTVVRNDGRAIVVGARSLLEGRVRNGSVRELTLYGRTGVVYTVELATSVTNATWTRAAIINNMTNLSRTINVGSGVNPSRYFRAKP